MASGAAKNRFTSSEDLMFGRRSLLLSGLLGPALTTNRLLAASVVTAFAPPSVPAPIAGEPGWTLAFDDDFEGTSLNIAKWATALDRPGDRAYSDAEFGVANWYLSANIRVRHSYLAITAKREPFRSPRTGAAFGYTSGLVASKPSFSCRFGFCEFRAKMPPSAGHPGYWPALWFWPEDENSTPEIDVIEWHGERPAQQLQTYHGEEGTRAGVAAGPDYSAGFHRYGVRIAPTGVDWYVDDALTFSVKTRTIDRPTYIVMNLAIANGQYDPPPTDRTPFPATLLVDYVRYWRLS
jgi:beta-glucanase (GH16 family)